MLLMLLALSLVAQGCAVPQIRLIHRFRPGEARTYRLVATADARIVAGATRRSERTTLEAVSRISVIAAGREGATLRLSVEPTLLRSGGREATPPAPQEAEVVVGPDGAIRAVRSIGGLPAGLSADLDDLGPLLSTPLPTGVLHLGDRWRRSTEGAGGRPGLQRGRLAALRIEEGYDCAIVALELRRPIERSRAFGGIELRLVGNETSAVEIAFAFRDGFPVRVSSVGEGTFGIAGVAGARGTVRLRTETSLRLVGRALGVAPSPSALPSAGATGSPPR